MELLHELSEYHRVHVLAQLVEHEPVAEPDPPADVVQLCLSDQPGPLSEDTQPQGGQEEESQSVDCLQEMVHIILSSQHYIMIYTYEDAGDDSKEDEPEPEEDVNLLVDDVEGKNAEAVFPLDSSRRTELVESTFCDLGEMKIVMNLCLFNVTFGKTAAMGSYLSS